MGGTSPRNYVDGNFASTFTIGEGRKSTFLKIAKSGPTNSLVGLREPSSSLTLSPHYICYLPAKIRIYQSAAPDFPKVYACPRQKVAERIARCTQISAREGVVTMSLALGGCESSIQAVSNASP